MLCVCYMGTWLPIFIYLLPNCDLLTYFILCPLGYSRVHDTVPLSLYILVVKPTSWDRKACMNAMNAPYVWIPPVCLDAPCMFGHPQMFGHPLYV